MMNHAVRQSFLATFLIGTLLSTALPVRGDDKPPATPPKWMPELTAEAIQRLSPKTARFCVYPRVCPAVPAPADDEANARRSVPAPGFCEGQLESLTLVAGNDLQVLKPFQIECSLVARAHGDTVKEDELDHEDSASVYLFKANGADPARILWDRLRADAGTELTHVGRVEVLRRAVPRKKKPEYFHYWSPRKGVAVVVRGFRSLDDTVRCWSVADPGPGPYPWDLREWKLIDADALSWGFTGEGVHRAAFRADPKSERPNAPPKWMPAATADAIQRLSPKVDRFIVSQGARAALPKTFDPRHPPSPKELAKKLGAFFGDRVYDWSFEQLNLLLGQDRPVLKPFKIVCSLQALSRYEPVGEDAQNHYDAVCVYIFRPDDADPARVLWDKLRANPSVAIRQYVGVEVLCRTVKFDWGEEDFYYWSPQPCVGVVVRNGGLLEETIQRWKVADPGDGPFPWTLPEWGAISAGASTWGISHTDPNGRGLVSEKLVLAEEKPTPSLVLSIDPKEDPAVVRLTYYGMLDFEFDATGVITKVVMCATADANDENSNGVQLLSLSMTVSFAFFPAVFPRFGP